ncbi:MAG TPA: YciI family protein [Candidatus Limnocylindrales bacterium]|nr:YciI family protein [Candidatus Limnocylindrales bacterium]
MTRYLLLIADVEDRPQTEAEFAEMMGEYFAFGDWLKERGWDRGGEALEPSTTATTVSVRDGQRIVTDGPFAETKEQLGGYYVIDVPSLDDALDAAARIPGARTGRVEVRPIMELGG